MATLTFNGYRKISTSIGNIIIPVYIADITPYTTSNMTRFRVNLPQGFTVGGSTPCIAIKENGVGHVHDMIGIVDNSNICTIQSSSHNIIVKRQRLTDEVIYRLYNDNSSVGVLWSARFAGSGLNISCYNGKLVFIIDSNNKIYLCTTTIGSNYSEITYTLPTQTTFGYSDLAFTASQNNYDFTGVDIPASTLIDISTDIYNGGEPWEEVTDPYADVGDSTTGGGDGTFDGSSDPVPVPGLPSIGATDTGFISLFVPSAAQIRQVATYLWGPLLDISTFKKLFEDPMDCILGLSVVPVAVPTSGNAQITVGNVELSGITLPLASQQYVELDCGTITFDRYFGSYLDFEPYTKMSLFVPYSGVHSVSADDIMGKTVGLKYHIDILTGSLVAFLTCGDSVLYEFNGACASNIPVNSMNYASTIENAIRIAVNIGTTVATAGAAAPATGAVEAGKVAAGGAGIGRGIAIAGSTAEGALSLKPSIDRAGSLGGTTGLMGNQIPYFIITRPRMCKPKNQDFFQGYPSFIQTVVGDMEGTGFTAFENVIIADTYLTETEKSELSSILSAGVYL